jgi:hypothetical protein
MITTKIRYSIIRVPVIRSGEIVEISHKLPAHLKVCTGFLARHTQGLKLQSDKPEIGLLALEFNSRKQLLINDVIGFQSGVQEIPNYQEVNIPLESGQLVTGYYMDTEQVAPSDFQPYIISIYLRCELEVKPADEPCTTT